MKRRTVDSQVIKSIGYDNTQKMLEVEFSDGNIYQYNKVPSLRFKSLLRAKSKGYYLAKKIKPRFAVQKIK
jgi:hypothetical protein